MAFGRRRNVDKKIEKNHDELSSIIGIILLSIKDIMQYSKKLLLLIYYIEQNFYCLINNHIFYLVHKYHR